MNPIKENNKVLYCFKNYLNLKYVILQSYGFYSIFYGLKMIVRKINKCFVYFYFYFEPDKKICEKLIKIINKEKEILFYD